MVSEFQLIAAANAQVARPITAPARDTRNPLTNLNAPPLEDALRRDEDPLARDAVLRPVLPPAPEERADEGLDEVLELEADGLDALAGLEAVEAVDPREVDVLVEEDGAVDALVDEDDVVDDLVVEDDAVDALVDEDELVELDVLDAEDDLDVLDDVDREVALALDVDLAEEPDAPDEGRALPDEEVDVLDDVVRVADELPEDVRLEVALPVVRIDEDVEEPEPPVEESSLARRLAALSPLDEAGAAEPDTALSRAARQE